MPEQILTLYSGTTVEFSYGLSIVIRALLMGLCGWFPAHALAQPYPSKPVRLVIPFPAGGSNDIVGRLVASKLSEQFERQVVVDNRVGADGIIGSELVARALPNGHTLLMISASFPMNAAVHKLPYDPLRSFSWVAMVGDAQTILVAYPGVPVSSVKDILSFARSNPGKMMYGSSGVGGFNHFAGELFRSLAGVNMVHVPYKGGGTAMIGTISGEVQLLFASSVLALPQVRSSKIKTIGTGGAKRSALLPDVPTIAESVPGYDANNYWGVLAPSGTPAAIVNHINASINTILAMPDMQKRFAAEGAEIRTMSPAEFGKLIATDITKWTRVAKDARILAQ